MQIKFVDLKKQYLSIDNIDFKVLTHNSVSNFLLQAEHHFDDITYYNKLFSILIKLPYISHDIEAKINYLLM